MAFSRKKSGPAMKRSKSVPDFAKHSRLVNRLSCQDFQAIAANNLSPQEALLSARKGGEKAAKLAPSSKQISHPSFHSANEKDWEEVLKSDRDRMVCFYVTECTLREAFEASSDPMERQALAQHHRANGFAIEMFLALPRVKAYSREKLLRCAVAGGNHIVRTAGYGGVLEKKGWRGLGVEEMQVLLEELYEAIAEIDREGELVEAVPGLSMGAETDVGAAVDEVNGGEG